MKANLLQRFGHTKLGQVIGKSLAQLTANFTKGLDLNDAGLPSSFTRPLAQSAWVHAAVSKVAGPIAAVDLCFQEKDEEIEDEALAEFWANPAINPDGSLMSAADFQETSAAWMLLRGEVFYLLDDSWTIPFPEVTGGLRRTPLIILRPDRLRHVVRSGELVEWVLTDADGRQIHLPPSRVVQIKRFNPYDPWRGLGNLEAALIAAGGDYAAGLFAKNTAEANGDQGVFIVAKGGLPGDEQREQIIAQLREKRSAQQRGIFRPAFLTGDITIEDPKIRSVDVAFVSQRQEARKEIAAAFGVPPSFFDPQASYSIGSASDRYILIEETCKPLGAKLCSGWAFIGSKLLGRRIEAKLDWDDHSVMQQVRRERIDGAVKLWNLGMPMREVSDYLSLDLPEFPGWDIGYLPFSVAPVTSIEAAPDATSDPALAETDPAEKMRALFAQRVPECDCCALPSDAEIVPRAGDSKQVLLWKSHMAKRRESLRIYKSKIDRALFAARSEVLANLMRAAVKSVSTKASALELMFDPKKFKDALFLNINSAAQGALQTAGLQVFKELGKDDAWKMPQPEVIQFIADRENRLAGVPDTVFNQIKNTLSAGLDSGDTMKQLADRVRAEFNSISDGRAKTIASTETGAAYGAGRHAAMKDAGVQQKQWLTSNNANVRAAHRLMNGATVPLDEPFLVINPKTGETDSILHPGDSDGAPWNVINCHCVEIAVVTPFEETPAT